jgi:hypothetical protein
MIPMTRKAKTIPMAIIALFNPLFAFPSDDEIVPLLDYEGT